jgi:hypothetical protein
MEPVRPWRDAHSVTADAVRRVYAPDGSVDIAMRMHMI